MQFLQKILLLGFFNIICLSTEAQESKFQLGINLGNHLSFTSFESNDDLKTSPLLRYSAGVLARYKLKTGIKRKAFHWIPPTKKGVFALDFGANLVFTGYDYQLGDLGTYQDQIMVEFSLMLVSWDERSVLFKRSWQRKRNTVYSKIGVKPSFLIKKNSEKELESDVGKLREQVAFGGFNLFGALSFGIMHTTKKHRSMMVELNLNLGLFSTTEGIINYTLNGSAQQLNFSSNGHYIALKTIYLFKSDIYRRIPTRTIYHPRFL
jgi:hypothetical protein